MKLGISVGYWGLGPAKDEQLAMARRAEALGFDSIWVAEAYGSDAPTVLAHLAGATERIGLGSAIMQIPARSAATTAMTAMTIDQLSGGRFRLGLGVSGPQVSEGWHGVRFARQLARTRDYVNVLRLALARERVAYRGETLQLPLPDGPGKPLKLTIGPVQKRLPILLAAMGPRNVALAGELADGWIPTFFSPEHVDVLRAPLLEGAERAGRDAGAVAVCPQVGICVSDDFDEARDAMRPLLALYIGGMGSRNRNFYAALAARYGYEAEARRVQDLYLSGRTREAMAALPDALIDATSICGPPRVVRARLDAFADTGANTLILVPVAVRGEDVIAQIERIAGTAGLGAAGTNAATIPFRDAMERADESALAASLAPDIEFRSPAVHTPYRGRDAVMPVLRAVLTAVEGLRYVDALRTDHQEVLRFVARAGNREVEGVDLLRFDADGLVSELTVMIRPLSGLIAVREAVGAALREADGDRSLPLRGGAPS